MLYYSTNKNSPEINFRDALFTGLAPDKGLYMPKNIPQITLDELTQLSKCPYSKIAEFVLGKYIHDTFSGDILKDMCQDAYNYPVPLENVFDRRFIMRLDQGPTASFKDFAARMMARFFGTLMKEHKNELIILTATSGDTGSAIAHAFYDIDNIKVMVLFPPEEISNRQRKQMTTLGKNISIIGINGKFDDCQSLIKQAFADKELSMINLTSANSINIGRILPQIVYYFYAYIQLAKIPEEIVFSIPSGNFGNMMGALLAKRMGLPICKLVISTNANDEVPTYLSTGAYKKIVPSRVCISNAMNVGHPSNFARVIDLYNGSMDETGLIHIEPNIDLMRNELWTTSIDDDKTRNTIIDSWKKYDLLLEPHGAVGWLGLNSFADETGYNGLMVSLETAHPAKFPEEIQEFLSITPDIPVGLGEIETKEEEYFNLPNNYSKFKKILLENYT